jgi:tRNA U34 5-methylaminomethyl-2-thiouridine-forming methyltransferase MnmC
VSARYQLVRLNNGTFSIRSLADGETFHPVEGPIAEAQALYIRQLGLRQRVSQAADSFVIWDVGLGAGGTVLTAIRELSDIKGRVHIVSFDRTLDALRFAVSHANDLQFPTGFGSQIQKLLGTHCARFKHGELRVNWKIHIGDFVRLVAGRANEQSSLLPPQAIFFDAFSPARNPEMWTLPLFENLFRCLDPQRSCSLATFSRSTLARVSMLLAGFFVGAGRPVAGKEETTIAANELELIAKPLDRRWLERARVSQSAEPLRENLYQRAKLTPHTWERLQRHPQFA